MTVSFVGIDIGATFLKGAVLDAENLRLGSVMRRPFPPFLAGLPDGFREVAPGVILSAIRELLEGLLSEAGTCEGILFCSQMHGLILLDREGRPQSNFISWQDQRALVQTADRSASFYERLAGRIGPEVRRRTGSELRPGIPFAFLFHMAESGMLPDRAIGADLGGLILSALTAQTPVMDRTMAHAHGAYNLETDGWDREMIASLRLDGVTWPEIVEAGTVAGFLEWGKGRIPCYAAVGDQQCSLLGAGLRTGELSLNIATGSQVSARAANLTYGDCQVRPYFGGHLHTITHIPAGRSLNLLVRLLTEYRRDPEDDAAAWIFIEKRVKEIRETDLVVDLSFFPGACGDRGRIDNIHEENLSVGHLFRAVFESMADNYRRAALRLPEAGNWDEIVFSGGLARRSAGLREAVAGRFGLPARVTPSDDDSLLGLLALARAALTSISPEEAAEEIRGQQERTKV